MITRTSNMNKGNVREDADRHGLSWERERQSVLGIRTSGPFVYAQPILCRMYAVYAMLPLLTTKASSADIAAHSLFSASAKTKLLGP